MGRLCSCCISPKRAEIDMAISSGATSKAIAESVGGVNASQVSRHKRKCLAPMSESDQVQLWLGRAEELWHLAGANGDVRGMASAVQQGLRSLEFALKRKEEAQADPLEAVNLPANFKDWPPWASHVAQRYLDSIIQNVELPSPAWAHAPEPERKVIARTLLPIRN
jgi:hypothetical protein